MVLVTVFSSFRFMLSGLWYMGFGFDSALEVTHGQILNQSPTDATRFW